MSPSKKSAKKQPPQPERVDFRTWKDRFEKALVSRTPEARALTRWMKASADYSRHIGDFEHAQRDSLLKSIYSMTLPNIPTGAEKKRQDSMVAALRALAPKLRSTAGAIKVCGKHVVPADGTPELDLSELLFHLDKSSVLTEGALLFLDRKRVRSADVLSHCAVFLSTLSDCGVAEPAALALTRTIMGAHGYTNDELKLLSPKSGRLGTPRKRKKDVISTYFDVAQSFLELKRKIENRPPFNAKLFRRRLD